MRNSLPFATVFRLRLFVVFGVGFDKFVNLFVEQMAVKVFVFVFEAFGDLKRQYGR